MTKIIVGTDATIKADSAEGQLFYGLLAISLYEGSAEFNPDKLSNVAASFSVKSAALNVTFTFPCQQSHDDLGNTTFKGANYLQGVPFMAGNPLGTYKSGNLVAYTVESLLHVQSLENNLTNNPSKINNIIATLNTDTLVLTGSAKIPCDVILDAATGTAKFVPKEYLAS